MKGYQNQQRSHNQVITTKKKHIIYWVSMYHDNRTESIPVKSAELAEVQSVPLVSGTPVVIKDLSLPRSNSRICRKKNSRQQGPQVSLHVDKLAMACVSIYL